MASETFSAPVRRVILVDSRESRRELMRLVVAGDDSKAILVGEADTKATALEAVHREAADAVILDVQMPVSEGLATIAALRGRYAKIGIIACSFDLDPSTVQQVLGAGADACLAKPVNRTEVYKALKDLPDYDRPDDGAPDLILKTLPAGTAR